MLDLTTYINNETIVLIPVLYFIGNIIKGIQKIDNKWIPIILLPIGVTLSMMILKNISVDSFIQGVLTTAASTYANQIYKQFKNNNQ